MQVRNFKNGTEMYEYLLYNGDLYSKSLGIYVFEYNDAHAICIYHLDNEDVEKIINRCDQTGETYWGGFLGGGGNILDDTNYDEYRYVSDETKHNLYIQPSLDFCNENYNKDWVDTYDLIYRGE